MNKNQKSIIAAYEKGYRVTEEGKVISSIGNILQLKLRKGVFYPRISVNLPEINPKNSISILAHQLAAYCFYKEKIFEKGIVVRHLNSDLLNLSKENIVLGTQLDNIRDKNRKDRVQQNKIEWVEPEQILYIPSNPVHISIPEIERKNMTQSNQLLLYAYEKGYRVTEEGEFLNPKGQELKIKIRDNSNRYAYPKFTINVYELLGKRASTFTIHRFAALCFYGEKIFEKGLVVRHLNGNVLDVRKENIVLGTSSENELDKSPEKLVKRKYNAKIGAAKARRSLTDEQVTEVRNLFKRGLKQTEIARKTGIKIYTVGRIVRDETYTFTIPTS